MARWRICNVLQSGGDLRNLWQFSAGGKFNLQKQETKVGKDKLTEKLIARDWQTLFQPRLDIAWLASHKVFLRVIQLPKADLAETQSMIDLQLEKLSPVPVAQVVWGFDLVPTAEPDMQTAVVIIVPRSEIDAYLASLEAQGFSADRLELPFIDQLRATKPDEDGVWIYPAGNGVAESCLIAWWYHGTLRNLSMIHLPALGDKASALQHQLAQMTWAGELEGWLTSPPRYHLVADPDRAEAWRNYFSAEQPLEVAPSVTPTELAGLTARRSVAGEPRTNLLPPEYSARYKQQFVDRLWMRSLGAVLAIYCILAGAYVGWVQVEKWRFNSVEGQVAALGPTYTNVVQIKERVRIMQEQLALQYAALECYRAIAETLPSELTLDSLNFDRGQKLTLTGSAASADLPKVLEFNDQLMRVRVKDGPLFSAVDPPQQNTGPNNQIRWRFSCDLKREL